MNIPNEQAKLLEALQIIKETCESHEHCCDCPLGDDASSCRVEDAPHTWACKNSVEPVIWRAFR